MNQARYKHALCFFKGRVLAFGGFSSHKSILKTVEEYDFDKNQWRHRASMLFERKDLTILNHQDSKYIYAFGGCF